ncbi:MAG: pitrilysin family protein [Ahrensia sp.]|nr:pitrilysin family protein [Ahrensia sp.]
MRLIAFMCVCALVWVSPAFATETTKQTTPNGHVYWHHPIADSKRTAVAISWPSGLSQLPQGQEMAARVGLSMMLNAGTENRSPEEVVEEFNDLDAGSQLFIQPGEFRGFIVTPTDAADEAAQIANDVLTQPNLDERWFKRERNKLLQEGRGREKHIWGIAWTLLRRATFKDHPFERFWSLRPTENIENINLDTIKAWHASALSTNDITITVAGSSDFAAIGRAIDTALAGLPGGEAPREIAFDGPIIPSATILFHMPDAEKSALVVFGQVPPSKAGQDFAINLGVGVLGYGEQSRLFKAIRTELRAAYRFGTGLDTFTRHHRTLRLNGEVDTKLLRQALDTVEASYEEFRKGGIGFLEFPFAKNFYRGRLEESFKKPENLAYLMMESRLDGEPDDHIDTMLTRLDDTSRSDVNAFIAENFPPFDDMLKVIVSPDVNAIEGACVITKIEQVSGCLPD